jgi:alpha-N-arabinofuranosidase
MGIRQKESNFEYRAKMEFQPNAEGAEAGISLFLQDDNYINMTVIREGKEALLKLKIKERNKEPRIAKSIGLKDYEGKILFQVISRNGKYRYTYSLDEGSTFALLAETDADLILCHGYTGVYLGLYGSSNGGLANEYADFDYITYQEY